MPLSWIHQHFMTIISLRFSSAWQAMSHLKTNYRVSGAVLATRPQYAAIVPPQRRDSPLPHLRPSAPTFPYKTAASPKHFIKTLSRWKSTPLPSAQPPPLSHNLDSISRRKRLFDIPHHKWNIFCVLDPARSSLPPGLIREFSCFIFMQSTLMKQPLIIRWLPLLYTEVSCYRLIYALLILMRYRTMSLCIPISTGEILIPASTYNCSSGGINCLQHRRLVFTDVLLCPETMETRQRTFKAQTWKCLLRGISCRHFAQRENYWCAARVCRRTNCVFSCCI